MRKERLTVVGLLARSHGYSGGNWSTHNFYHADGNGNITYLVSSSQTLAAGYRYDPFGNTISKSGSLADANVYRFSSKECLRHDSGDFEVYYYGYRFYAPSLQRWLNRDPIKELGGINLYGFVGNSPIDFVDLFGLRFGNQPPPCFPYPDCLRSPSDPGPWDDGYSDCWSSCMLNGVSKSVGPHAAWEGAGAKKAAQTYYRYTDGRFKAWGRSSKVLVPRLKHALGLPGLLWTCYEAFHCMEDCLQKTSGADPEPPVRPYYPPENPLYPVEWPGEGNNKPPPVIIR